MKHERVDVDLSEPAPLTEREIRAFWVAMCHFPDINYAVRAEILRRYSLERAKPDFYANTVISPATVQDRERVVLRLHPTAP